METLIKAWDLALNGTGAESRLLIETAYAALEAPLFHGSRRVHLSPGAHKFTL